MFGLASLPLWALAAIFAVAAAAVWFGGTRLAEHVDALAQRTGAGQALLGMLLLGGITSLPELAAVSTSAATGHPDLAVNNLLGTASINVLLLALADIRYGREALTVVAGKPATLMQGVLSMLLALIVTVLAITGDRAIGPVGIGGVGVAVAALAAIWIASDFERRHVWDVVGGGDDAAAPEEAGSGGPGLRRLALLIAGCAALILAAGFALSLTADAIAERTGAGRSMIGFLLVGFATSLPELSSIMAAVRLRRYQMAIGDVFGTNIFNLLLIAVADLAYAGGPVLDAAGPFEAVGAALAAIVTGLLVVGLLERRDRTILRMGYDSLATLLAFAGGIALLARLS
jgi:cation:H+ antiporter